MESAANAIPLSSDQEVRAAVSENKPALLVSFTASWCQPCQSFAPVLAAVKQAGAGQFEVMKVDIDACPDIAREFGVRGIPATILFKQGTEHDRFVGAKSRQAVAAWLAARGILVDATKTESTPAVASCAFYGDPGLKQFLVERLYQMMDAGKVRGSFTPDWQDGQGSVSAALVRHRDPEVFERITGMPYGVACVLEFLGLESRQDAEDIFAAIAPGSDTQLVPLRFVHAWLSHESLGWTAALDSMPHDTLRRDWCKTSQDMLSGTPVSAEHWTALRKAALALITDRDPHHMLEDDVAMLISCMSPPPSAFDGDEWRSLLLGSVRFSRARLMEYRAGWKKPDTAQHSLRDQWFRQHVPLDADGRFDQKVFEAARTRWEQDHADFVVIEREMHEHYAERLDALTGPFRSVLAVILRSCDPAPGKA